MVNEKQPSEPQIKMVDPAALASLTGHPVWTHQYPALAPRLADLALLQYPTLPTRVEVIEIGWEAVRDAIRAELGAKVPISRGSDQPLSPFDHAPKGVPTFALVRGGK